MTDTKDVAYVRERLCKASDVLDEIFVKTKEISEENTKFKKELKEICEKYLEMNTTVDAYEDVCKDLKDYIKQLKDLLKECKPFVELCNSTPENKKLIENINSLLGEE